jgi:glycosyltransferase involved in cell wall biosynthesis
MKLSVLVPVCKTDKQIFKECIDSILNQTFKDFELIVLNDDPKDYQDNYKELLDNYKDDRIRYFTNGDNLGSSASMNKLLNLARCEYIAICDSDDISLPDRFMKQVTFLDEHKEIDVVSAIIEKFGSETGLMGKVLPSPQISKALITSMVINNPVIIARKDSLLKGELFDLNYTVANDYEFWSRRTDLTYAILPDVLLKYRKHSGNITNKVNELKEETLKIIKRNIDREAMKLKVALVCIAKDEDKYIDEWIKYHLKLGFDQIFIYCNDWDWKLPEEYGDKVIAINWPGLKQQVPSYNDFIKTYHDMFDFAAFTDIDEFIALKKTNHIKKALYNYRDIGLLRLPIRTMGNSGLDTVKDNNYSVINRFLKGRTIYESIGKYIVNLNIIQNKYDFIDENWFGHLPCTNPNRTVTWNSYYNYFINDDNNDEPIELYHYITKTWEEYLKRKTGTDAKKGILNYPEDKIKVAYNMINNEHFSNAKNYTVVYDFYHDLEKQNVFVYNFTVQFNSINHIPIIKELYTKESAVLICLNKTGHVLKINCDFDGTANFKNIQIANGTYYIRGIWKEGYYNFTKYYVVKFENGKIYYNGKEVNKIMINNGF